MRYYEEVDSYYLSDNMIYNEDYSIEEMELLIRHYGGLIKYLKNNRNKIECGVYANDNMSNNCNYFYDINMNCISYGKYHTSRVTYKVSNLELIKIYNYLKKLIKKKQLKQKEYSLKK